MSNRFRFFVSSLLILTGMVSAMSSSSSAEAARIASHSFAHPSEIVMTHLDLDLDIDFDAQRLRGVAILDLDNPSGTRKLTLDTWALDVLQVTLDPEGSNQTATFRVGDRVSTIGSPLVIDIQPDTRQVRIEYETTDDARALQWLTPEQTRDKTAPFLYTQSQSINARSWVPCQDVPSVRFTFAARVQVPKGLFVLMGARNTFETSPDGTYTFDMPQPIPAYLLALAAGDIEFKAISDRCGVFAEPSMVEAAAWEFADVEKMMRAAEDMYGPYRWERFDSIVLPPSFPFGGMENPRVTFLTPTIVAGDRSLVSTVAHELAHSWSGNLVTNAAWEDFWLNEGFTTYFEQRIMEELYGRDVSEMHAVLGLDDLQASIASASEHPERTALYVELDDSDPDMALGTPAYQKGYLFLRMLEESVGRAEWDAFLRQYFDAHAFQSMTTQQFLSYMQKELFGGDAGELKKRKVHQWVYEGGLPDNAPQPQSPLFEHAEAQVQAWNNGAAARSLEVEGWSTQEWDYFLTHINETISADRMAELDDAFSFDESNGMLQRSWYQLVIHNDWKPGYEPLRSFLVHVGRRWLVRPLYASLAKTDSGLKWARQVYAEARPGYHPLTTRSVDRTLELRSGE